MSFFLMVDVKITTRSKAPTIPFEAMARQVLGARYELSLVVCGDRLATKMNKAYRKKSYAPNVLSFPLDKENGEIFLNVRKAEREARIYGVNVRDRLALLYVHGLWHLKGYDHSDKMEQREQDTLKKFGF
jgi:probable rRNA maturation factor